MILNVENQPGRLTSVDRSGHDSRKATKTTARTAKRAESDIATDSAGAPSDSLDFLLIDKKVRPDASFGMDGIVRYQSIAVCIAGSPEQSSTWPERDWRPASLYKRRAIEAAHKR